MVGTRLFGTAEIVPFQNVDFKGCLKFQHAIKRDFSPVLDGGADLNAVDYAAFNQVFESPGKVLRADAVHGGAQAARVVEGDYALAFIGEAAGQAVDQVNLGADGEHGPLWGV